MRGVILAGMSLSANPHSDILHLFVDIEKMVTETVSYPEDTNIANLYEKMRQGGKSFAAIVHGDKPLGLCSRRSLAFLLRTPEGCAFYGNKHAKEFLMESTLFIKSDLSSVEILDRLTARPKESFYDDIILTDPTDKFIGVIEMKSFFLKLTEWICLQAIRADEKAVPKMHTEFDGSPARPITRPVGNEDVTREIKVRRQGTAPIPTIVTPVAPVPPTPPTQPATAHAPVTVTSTAMQSDKVEEEEDEDDEDAEFHFPPHLVKLFLTETENRIAELQKAWDDKNNEVFTRAAHTIKGTAANFQAYEIQDIALKLEKLGKENNLEAATPLIIQLKDQFAMTNKKLTS